MPMLLHFTHLKPRSFVYCVHRMLINQQETEIKRKTQSINTNIVNEWYAELWERFQIDLTHLTHNSLVLTIQFCSVFIFEFCCCFWQTATCLCLSVDSLKFFYIFFSSVFVICFLWFYYSSLAFQIKQITKKKTKIKFQMRTIFLL